MYSQNLAAKSKHKYVLWKKWRLFLLFQLKIYLGEMLLEEFHLILVGLIFMSPK